MPPSNSSHIPAQTSGAIGNQPVFREITNCSNPTTLRRVTSVLCGKGINIRFKDLIFIILLAPLVLVALNTIRINFYGSKMIKNHRLS